jgi:hypothetical protein
MQLKLLTPDMGLVPQDTKIWRKGVGGWVSQDTFIGIFMLYFSNNSTLLYLIIRGEVIISPQFVE